MVCSIEFPIQAGKLRIITALLGRDALAMQRRIVGLQELPLAHEALELPPESTRMPVGAAIASPHPALIPTDRMGAKLVLGVYLAWASPCGGRSQAAAQWVPDGCSWLRVHRLRSGARCLFRKSGTSAWRENRHARAGGHPATLALTPWMPACAGMTQPTRDPTDWQCIYETDI
jgi:hypothetical protein